ncbi:MAG: RNA methyltransferase [Flavobacteriaceae bacterium]|nr:RNA methyltransferase [Flavobacteriaceae bacterium]
MIKKISSLQNPLIKQWVTIKEKSRARKRLGIFMVEGIRETSLALKGGCAIETLIFNPDLVSVSEVEDLKQENTQLIEVSKEIYHRLAYRATTEGILAIAKSKNNTLESLKFNTKTPLILIAEAPEKPGNIGALLRTADAANIDAVIIANPKTDLYNPNIIRSSIGCLFTNQVATGTTTEIIEFLNTNNINIYCAALQASSPYYLQDFSQATAIIVGSEATGLTKEWLRHSTKNIIIPMQGAIDSMNVSVAAGILIFEAKRQRGF